MCEGYIQQVIVQKTNIAVMTGENHNFVKYRKIDITYILYFIKFQYLQIKIIIKKLLKNYNNNY